MMALMAVAFLLQPPERIAKADGDTRPVFRTLQPGERRDEGLLRRIACPGRGPVTFVVKQKDAVVQYTAPQLGSVDFIVYRKDFRGPVSCEGFGAVMPVYVTWKPDGKSRRAIAIEFLPKPPDSTSQQER